MKFSILAVAATLAVANAADCELTNLATLLTDSNVSQCTTDSGFSFTAPTTPTGETLTKICASKACQTVLTAVRNLNLGDCTVLGIKLETDLLNPIAKGCGTSTGSGSGSSTGSKSSTATVTTPSSTTKAPSTSSSKASSGSSTSSSTVTTPSPTTSASTKVTVAASAAAVAIAAAFM